MSSYLRNIQRKFLRKKGDYLGTTMPVRYDETGYFAYHPTRGYRRISFKRAELYK